MASFPVDMREGVIWAYRHLLGREPNDEEAISVHLAHTPVSLRQAFLASPEYALRHSSGAAPTGTSNPLLEPFTPFSTEPPPVGSFRDFIGSQTRCEFLPDGLASLGGKILGPPGSINGPIHDPDEWFGTLRSILEARDVLTVVELGAGWAPWLTACAVAARRVGITNVRLIGVEGSLGHVEYMRRNLSDNNVDPSSCTLIHGVVGAEDGIAYFPVLSEPNNVYGSQATHGGEGTSGANEMEAVPSISLGTLLADHSRVDLIHCDIQGAEGEVLTAGRDVLNARVRRIVVGTHGRAIEKELMDLFSGMGWVLEADTACRFLQVGDRSLVLQVDGVQVWQNPALASQ
jgi:FkbM family methyltransferase